MEDADGLYDSTASMTCSAMMVILTDRIRAAGTPDRSANGGVAKWTETSYLGETAGLKYSGQVAAELVEARLFYFTIVGRHMQYQITHRTRAIRPKNPISVPSC